MRADRFISTLTQGLDTPVRERGSNFSAGERQLLSFARALAHGGDVLVLDEATSSIDSESEALIQEGTHALMQGRTSLVIAHRLSTIQDVDRIHVLHKGRIVESGSTGSNTRVSSVGWRAPDSDRGGWRFPGCAVPPRSGRNSSPPPSSVDSIETALGCALRRRRA